MVEQELETFGRPRYIGSTTNALNVYFTICRIEISLALGTAKLRKVISYLLFALAVECHVLLVKRGVGHLFREADKVVYTIRLARCGFGRLQVVILHFPYGID